MALKLAISHVVVGVIVAAVAVSMSNAQTYDLVVNVDVNTSGSLTYSGLGAAVDGGTFWNGATFAMDSHANLLASNGATVTPYDIAASGASGFNITTMGNNLHYDYLYTNGGVTANWSLSQLEIGREFDLYFYGTIPTNFSVTGGILGGSQTAALTGPVFTNAAPAHADWGSEGTHYTRLRITPTANLISGTYTGGASQSTWSGLQIARLALDPEPPPLSGAGLISIDFDDAASPNTQVGDVNLANGFNGFGLRFAGQTGAWNSLGFTNTGAGGLTNATLTATNLLDGDGNPTGVEFRYNTGGGTYRTIEHPTDGSGQPLRSSHVFLDTGTSTSIDWEISGLEPGGVYDLIFFGQTGPQNESLWTIFGNPVTNDLEFDGNAIGIIADASGRITGTHEFLSGFSSWTGLQIRQQLTAAVPEPASVVVWVVLGLVAVGFCVWRRQ